MRYCKLVEKIRKDESEMDNMLFQLNRILSELIQNDDLKITYNSKFEELNLDSIENIEFFIKIEEYFGFEFEDEMLLPEKYSSMLDLCEYISKMIHVNPKDHSIM